MRSRPIRTTLEQVPVDGALFEIITDRGLGPAATARIAPVDRSTATTGVHLPIVSSRDVEALATRRRERGHCATVASEGSTYLIVVGAIEARITARGRVHSSPLSALSCECKISRAPTRTRACPISCISPAGVEEGRSSRTKSPNVSWDLRISRTPESMSFLARTVGLRETDGRDTLGRPGPFVSFVELMRPPFQTRNRLVLGVAPKNETHGQRHGPGTAQAPRGSRHGIAPPARTRSTHSLVRSGPQRHKQPVRTPIEGS